MMHDDLYITQQFLSTSLSKDVALRFLHNSKILFKITVSSSDKFIYILNKSSMPNEKEILFMPGTIFKTNKEIKYVTHDNKIHSVIEMKCVGNVHYNNLAEFKNIYLQKYYNYKLFNTPFANRSITGPLPAPHMLPPPAPHMLPPPAPHMLPPPAPHMPRPPPPAPPAPHRQPPQGGDVTTALKLLGILQTSSDVPQKSSITQTSSAIQKPSITQTSSAIQKPSTTQKPSVLQKPSIIQTSSATQKPFVTQTSSVIQKPSVTQKLPLSQVQKSIQIVVLFYDEYMKNHVQIIHENDKNIKINVKINDKYKNILDIHTIHGEFSNVFNLMSYQMIDAHGDFEDQIKIVVKNDDAKTEYNGTIYHYSRDMCDVIDVDMLKDNKHVDLGQTIACENNENNLKQIETFVNYLNTKFDNYKSTNIT